jgi:hypothetical protein
MNHELDVLRRVVEYHDHIAAPPVHVADDLHRGRRRVRRNRGLLAGGMALGLASVVAAVSLLAGEKSVDRPQPVDAPGLTTPLVAPQSLLDIREVGFHVEPAPGFDASDDWGIDRDQQWTNVVLDDGGLDLGVAVYYQGMSPDLPDTGTRESVTVNGDAGTYVEEIRSDYWGANLAWEYAPDSWAVVSGRGLTAPPPDLRGKLLAVAEAVRSGGEAVRVPVRFGTVPESLPAIATAHSVNVSDADGEWLWWLSVGDISLWATSRAGGDCLGSDGRPQTEEFTYRGIPGCLVAGERIGLHLGDADVFFDYGPSPGLPIEDMKRVLADLTVAPDDRATWFDLKTSLGG